MKYRIVELNNGDIHLEHEICLGVWEYVDYFKTYKEANEYLDKKLSIVHGSKIKQVIREEEV